MMSDFRGGGGSKMTPKNWIIEGKNRIKRGRGGQEWPQKIGNHLCMIPYGLAQKIWTRPKHFGTCKRTRHKY